MNQILSTSMPFENNKKSGKNKSKNRGPVDIKNVLMFFVIALIIFGVCLIGTGSYALYKNNSVTKEEVVKPTISIEKKDDKTLILKVMHQKNISEVSYGWNDEQKTILEGNGRKYIEQEVSIPAGSNTLYVNAKDINGEEISYQKLYELDSNIDFEVSGNKIKITYNGEKTISYMTYRWDEEQETKIDINDNKIEQEIEAQKGLHTLTVVVVDVDNKTESKVQKINGVAKPNVKVELDSEVKHFVIKASDDIGLQKIEFILNGDENQKYLLNYTEKELVYTLPMELQPGENSIKVIVYNSNGITEQFSARVVI